MILTNQQSGVIFPGTLPATDLNSAIAAANATGQILNTLYGPGMPTNNVYPQQPFGYTTLAGPTRPGPLRMAWTEDMAKRVIDTKRFYATWTNQIWIDVERIKHMELYNTVSGDTLVWDFGDG